MKRNRTLIGVVCILLAVLLCFGLTPIFNKLLSGKAEIVRVAVLIPQGTLIDDEMLQTVTVGSYGLPEEVMKTREEVVGKYATAELHPDSYILPSQLEESLKNSAHILAALNGEKWAISVTVSDLANSLSAKIRCGDIVSVLALATNGEPGVIYPELQYLEVITSTNKATTDIDETAIDSEDKIPITITLLANARQAKILAGLSSAKTAHFALVCRKENTALSENLLTAQDKLLAEIADSPIAPAAADNSEAPVNGGAVNE